LSLTLCWLPESATIAGIAGAAAVAVITAQLPLLGQAWTCAELPAANDGSAAVYDDTPALLEFTLLVASTFPPALTAQVTATPFCTVPPEIAVTLTGQLIALLASTKIFPTPGTSVSPVPVCDKNVADTVFPSAREAVRVTVPLAVGVTAVEITPLLVACTVHCAEPHAASVALPAVTASVTLAFATGALFPSTTSTIHGDAAANPVATVPDGAPTSISPSAAVVP
jgi:hypothetical protein